MQRPKFRNHWAISFYPLGNNQQEKKSIPHAQDNENHGRVCEYAYYLVDSACDHMSGDLSMEKKLRTLQYLQVYILHQTRGLVVAGFVAGLSFHYHKSLEIDTNWNISPGLDFYGPICCSL